MKLFYWTAPSGGLFYANLALRILHSKQLLHCAKPVAFFFPLGQQLIQDLRIGPGSGVEQHHRTGVGPGEELFQGLLPGGLVAVVPVGVGQAPEYRFVSQLLGVFQEDLP